ncbi:MAG: hypothetical protein HN742_19205 [Lentisphaerae bacterium]|nr:hypothetical protein [Lentisphaerota bacterium]MBT4817251.1 hypothetical protein [Lentisphaerota bacterium]MBT5608465.1 hypothetical protein [Lentisphaerota bacterium]MBT7060285.1 hypothetical protein [Lentisphaerota bacterium]MBT7844016.1 hypothetical protein [Lentisphaerota bacterium]
MPRMLQSAEDIHQLPPHLPRKLSISFWLWNYFYSATPGDTFHDLEKRVIELKERKFNTIRLDAGIGLCFTPEGKPRGEIVLHEPFRGFSSRIRQMNGRGGTCDVVQKLLELFELAKKHDVYVIMSSWFYLHTFWFADETINNDMFRMPVGERLMHMAREFGWLIALIKERDLHSQIAFIEVANECDGSPFHFYCDANPGSPEQQRHGFRELHETALASLRQQHPDLLFACDTSNSKPHPDLLPGNMQLWNHHMYYMWDLYFDSFEAGIRGRDFDPDGLRESSVISPFLREDAITMEAIRRSAGDNPRVAEGWYRRVWLYNNTDVAKLGNLDRWYAALLSERVEEFKDAAERGINRVVALRNQQFPGLPLVLGEAVSYCTHTGLRFEEQSDDYWQLLEHTTHLLKKAGYWGYMPRTHSGPEDPGWAECADRFRYLNGLFLEDT